MSDTVDFKVAIMTFHMAHNYGAMLQAYALQQIIESMGFNCEILDYRIPCIYNINGISTYSEYVLNSGFWKGTIRCIWRHLNGWYRNLPHQRKAFDSFMRNDMKLSPRVYFQRDKLNDTRYDAVVFGSDQIWNSNLTGGFAPEYLGAFFDEHKTALISYAASCGKGILPPDYKDKFVDRLRRFLAVGVRETSLSDYLVDECGIPAKVVLDPVLLADPAIWEPLIQQGGFRIAEPYLLIYSFDAGNDIFDVALRVAHERNLKPVAVCYKYNPQYEGIEQLLSCGPKDFLSLMFHADFICTTSFHGLAFSILFEKNFYCMAHPEVGQRERDLIEMLGLQERFLKKLDDLKMVTNCDYTEVRKKVSEYRKESFNFLNDALIKAQSIKLDHKR